MATDDLGSIPDALDVLTSWSSYVEGFMTRRSMVTASLFPEKSAQLTFGYEYCARVLPKLTDSIAAGWAPEEFGVALRAVGSGHGLRLASALWAGSLGMLSRVLRHQGDVSGTPLVINYWSRALSAYLGESGYAWRDGTTLRPTYRVWSDGRLAPVVAALDSDHGATAAKLSGALANYCWLLECESRQSVFSHGPYDTAGGRSLLVKEFLDVRGDAYPWMPESRESLPRGTITVALELTDWSAQFDVLGTLQSDLDLAQMGINAAVVLVDEVPVIDLPSWAGGFLQDLQAAHRGLYRTVARWERRDRFAAGPSTHARLWRALLAASGANFATINALVDEPLEEHLRTAYGTWNSEPGIDGLWSWVTSPGGGTVFGPLAAALTADGG